jgi:RNA polymerase sigma-70 factor (ECF subfamily)
MSSQDPRPDGRIGDLVARAVQGDEAAIACLYELSRPRMIGLVHRRLGHKLKGVLESVDLVQSVWKDVLEELPGFEEREPGAFLRWLHTCLLHKIYEKHRYHDAAKRDIRRLTPLPDDGLGPLAGRGPTPSQDVARHDDVALVMTALQRFGETQRRLMLLRMRDGLPFREIAQKVQMTEEATRKSYRRGLQRLLGMLPADWRPRDERRAARRTDPVDRAPMSAGRLPKPTNAPEGGHQGSMPMAIRPFDADQSWVAASSEIQYCM